FRIVILWFLVLLSPVAFMGSVLPSFQRYANQWWEKFTSQVIVGPILAFFLWLSFSMVQTSDNIYKTVVVPGSQTEEYIAGGMSNSAGTGTQLSAAISEAGRPEYILNFIIGIGMLLGSLMVAQQMGVAGGKMAGQALGKIQAMGSGVAKWPFKTAGKGIKSLSKYAVKSAEASVGIPLTKERWQRILADRREWIDKKRDAKFIKQREKGILSFLPKGEAGEKGWSHVLTWKEGGKAIGRVFQGLTGKADKLRKKATEMGKNKQEEDETSEHKIREGEILNQDKQYENKLNEQRENKNQLETNSNIFTKSGDRIMQLDDVDKYIENLEAQIEKARSKNEDDPWVGKAEIFLEGLKKQTTLAKKGNQKTIDLNTLGPNVDKNFYSQNITKWFNKEVKTAGQAIEKTEQEQENWQKKKKNYEFTKEDYTNVRSGMTNLEMSITELNLDEQTKNKFLKRINDLQDELGDGSDDAFNKLSQEKKNELAHKAWTLKDDLEQETDNLKKEGKIDTDQIMGIKDFCKKIHSSLSKEVIKESFTREDHEKTKGNIKNLAATIETLDLSPEAKNNLQNELNALQKELETPFDELTLGKRNRIASQFEKIKDNLNQEMENNKIAPEKAQKISDSAQGIHSTLNRRVVGRFTREDHEKTKGNIKNLAATIETLDLSPEAKGYFQNELNALQKELETPFDKLTPEKKSRIANQFEKIKDNLNQEMENNKIAPEKAQEISDSAQGVHLILEKEKKLKEKIEKRKQLEHEIADLQSQAEMIQPRTMTAEQRRVLNVEVMKEYESVKEIDDSQELITLYRQAEKKKNVGLAKAILMKLNSQNDINEILGEFNLEQNFRGMADLGKIIHDKLGISQQEAYMFINDLSFKNKNAGLYRLSAAVGRDKRTGLYRPLDEEEHKKIVLIESGKAESENFYRKASWAALFGKKTDPNTGERIPIFDETTEAMLKRDIDTIHKELLQNFRLEKEMQRNMAHKNVLDGMKNMLSAMYGEAKIKMEAVIKDLERKQKQFWS
ncbi:MAG: hypothetical protein PHG59_03110, partial [Patescibacteria group bacterium]|nr:hypothetical protein [Patescibacteria group bacterium]